ncbi:hypothetical protein JOE61_002323 [Nocardioides salarius]|uniref:Uncharacterized protein n=1 Tax=Nocardioides salarius TaxID=374513 RepID=A0ABS2MBE6_9ACTN|nr:hypothetical protein [Nocardioides salarius]MBM7508509.1 hypothetical protein [Nocardioides salarius]
MDEVATIGLVAKVLADSSAHVGPGHLAQAALREERWRDVEREWGMLAAVQVALLTGARPESARSLTANLRRRKGMAGVKRRGGLLYPGFQFVRVAEDRVAVAPAWTTLRELLAPASWSDADVLAWAAAPNANLEGRSPAQEVHEHPASLSDALRNAVARAVPASPSGTQSA